MTSFGFTLPLVNLRSIPKLRVALPTTQLQERCGKFSTQLNKKTKLAIEHKTLPCQNLVPTGDLPFTRNNQRFRLLFQQSTVSIQSNMCTCSDFYSHHTSTSSEFYLICLEISGNYEIKLIQESALVEAVDGAE